MKGMTKDPLALVGNAADGTITVARLTRDGLVPLSTCPVGEGCSTFAVDAPRDLVYCATTSPTPAIVTLALDRYSGSLAQIARTNVGQPLAYLRLAPGGGLLLGASYHGGWGAVWPITAGRLDEPTGWVEYPNLHCVITDPDGRNAYFVSLGADLIAQYELFGNGELAPLASPHVCAPAGSGPRHLTLSADGTNAYLVTEFSGEVIRYARAANGSLAQREAVNIADPDAALAHSRFGANPSAEGLIWGADVHLAGGGRHLLASERCGSTVAAVALDPTGVLGEVISFWATPQQPRGFGVAPDGVRFVVAGEASGAVELDELATDGTITKLQRLETGAGPNWVRFA